MYELLGKLSVPTAHITMVRKDCPQLNMILSQKVHIIRRFWDFLKTLWNQHSNRFKKYDSVL